MSIFIDTANIDDARSARDFGWVSGITTNPLLLANSGESVSIALQRLTELNTGALFYQITSTSLDNMLEEAYLAKEIIGEQLVVKIPPVEAGFRAASNLYEKIPCCITAVFSVTQAIVAQEGGARYIAVYVNRAEKLLGDGLSLVKDIAKVLNGGTTQILAASIKSSAEAGASILAGANHITAPLHVLRSLTTHELSEEVICQFKSEGVGLCQKL